MSALECALELSDLLDRWVDGRPSREELIPLLKRIAEVIEDATKAFYKQDPDPFDDRHPCRAHPDCALGHMLKKVVRCEEFISALFDEYMSNSAEVEVNIVSCRLLLDLSPGLDTRIFHNRDGVLSCLILWAERASNPLRSYAIGVLAVIMEDEDIASHYKEQNACLVPVLFERLKDLSVDYFKSSPKKDLLDKPYYAHQPKELSFGSEVIGPCSSKSSCVLSESLPVPCLSTTMKEPSCSKLMDADICFNQIPDSGNAGSIRSEASCSSKSECETVCNKSSVITNEMHTVGWSSIEALMIGTYQVYPLTAADEQRYILQYLSSIAEYQELLTCVFENPRRTIMFLLQYIDLKKQPNVRLAFDALKFLALLMSHKKFAIDFVSKIGIHHILHVHRPSLAATGVSFVLYYIAYTEDAVQKICLLPREVVWDLVNYALWLLECSHPSGRVHATMFFGLTLQYDAIREMFSEQDGLRKLLNVISTLDVLTQNLRRFHRGSLSADALSSNRQICRHVCFTLKKLYESYAEAKAFSLWSSQAGSSKARYSQKSLEENVETILNLMPSTYAWDPAEELLRFDGISLLLKLILMNFDWTYSGKVETIKSSLDVLFVCSVCDKVKLAICEPVSYVTVTHEQQTRAGMSIILQAAQGEHIQDGDVRRAALNVIVNCVCKPSTTQTSEFAGKSCSPVIQQHNTAEMMNKIWNCVRLNNGIMILCAQLTIKSPVTEADAVRALACQALCGLANCPKVMQIVSKLPLITSGHLRVLMQEPVLRDKRQEHSKFVHYCTKLMEMVVGRSVNSLVSNLNKAEVISQTVISYNEKQLLQLIVDYLCRKGYTASASVLQEEAKLKPLCRITNSSSSLKSQRMDRRQSFEKSLTFASASHHKSHIEQQLPSSSVISENRQISLDSIVSEYLRSQHALCKNPYVTCPPFDLFKPHQCSEPSARNVLTNNISARVLIKQYDASHWGHSGASMMKKYLSGRFRDVISFQDPETDNLTSCAFSEAEKKVYIGTYGGEVRIFRLQTGNEIYSFNAHQTSVTNIQFRKKSPLFLTSASWRRPQSALWDASENHHMLYEFSEECYVEFSKLSQDRVIGTKYGRARIYDVETGALTRTLELANFGNSYRSNRATFNYTDDLVLSDGVIWDVRSQTVVHKLDKFNAYINGVFHPNGLEIVSNSEIWDARTYRLLRTVPELEQCKILFDSTADVIYGAIISPETENKDDLCFKRYGTSFRSFDATDYTCIATKDIQKGIYDIALDETDRYLCVIQKPLVFAIFGADSSCHVYEIGRSKEGDDSDDMEDSDDDEVDDDTPEIQHSDDDDDHQDDVNDDDDDQGADEMEIVDDEEGSNDPENSSSSNNPSEDEFYFSLVN